MTHTELKRLEQLKAEAQVLLDDLNSFQPWLIGGILITLTLMLVSNI